MHANSDMQWSPMKYAFFIDLISSVLAHPLTKLETFAHLQILQTEVTIFKFKINKIGTVGFSHH